MLAAMVRTVWLYHNRADLNWSGGAAGVTNHQIVQTLEEHPKLRDFLGVGEQIATATGMIKSAAGAASYLVEQAQANNWKALRIGDRTAAVGRALVGTRYKSFTLEIDDRIEAPSANFNGMDCWTFYEIALGFARMLDDPEPATGLAALSLRLADIRSSPGIPLAIQGLQRGESRHRLRHRQAASPWLRSQSHQRQAS